MRVANGTVVVQYNYFMGGKVTPSSKSAIGILGTPARYFIAFQFSFLFYFIIYIF